ncbi:MAG TPA: ABC transporter ATP-binding protein [Propionibacteriaceae bacterium]|nr:ABC transporter ATP-binding protein [Propionibacteriaceae bacterium]
MSVRPVVVDDLSVSLGGVPILRDVSFAVDQGEVVALLGGNGSGKTTLVRAVLGLVPHLRGEVSLFGTPLADFHEWSRIGYVPQHASVSMHSTTVRELVTSGTLSSRRLFSRLGRAGRARVSDAIERVGLSAKADDAFVHLSGGQQQRVLIARALVSSPSLLVMDEPFAGVDVSTQQRLTDLVGSLRADGMAVLVVLHETELFAPLIDRAVVLREGRVAHNGGLDEHMAHGHETEPPARSVRLIEEVRPWT